MNTNTRKINYIDGEFWWGGCISDGVKMPIGESDVYTCDLYSHKTHNQTMPLFISDKGRVIWCDEGFAVEFNKGLITITSHGEIKVEDTGEGGNLQTAYALSERYTHTTEKILPEIMFKVPQYNSWIELMYNQGEVEILKYAKSIIDNGYKPGILMIDDNWQEDYGVWEFSTKRFTDPKSMIEKLTAMNFEVMLWVCPFVSPDSQTFRYLEEKEYLIKDKRGGVSIKQWWNGYSAIIDFTNPRACEWLKERLDYLVDFYGVKGFKFDAGDLWNYDGENDEYYEYASPLEQVRLYSEFAANYEYNELRTGYKTANLLLSQRLCDKTHTWGDTGIASLIPNGLLQNLMGYRYNCPDMIGGGEYKNFLAESMVLDEELVVRYAQIAAFFPIMQFSASPWRVLSKENSRYCYEAAELHLKFSDYIIEEIKVAIENNQPLMKHMTLQFPGEGYEKVDEQYMLGRRVLVAPVTRKGETVKTVYIPAGRWRSDKGELFEGPCKISMHAPLCRLPYFVLND